MEYNEKEFFEFEKSSSILLDSIIDYLCIEFKNGIYTANINFSISHQKKGYKNILINIEEITAININQTVDSIEQQIHNYKFLQHEGSYYLSLDPDESALNITNDDQTFFLFNKLKAKLK